MQLKTVFRRLLTVSAALLCFFTVSSLKANASLIAAICNDLACSGGDDFIVLDNTAPDTIPLIGGLNFAVSAFGFSLAVNTSQSKPLIGSAFAPQLDLTFSATTNSSVSSSVFLFASDTDFMDPGLFPQQFALTLGGTNSGGSGSANGRAWGGTNNTALSFSGANLISATGPLSGATYSGATLGTLSPRLPRFRSRLAWRLTAPHPVRPREI